MSGPKFKLPWIWERIEPPATHAAGAFWFSCLGHHWQVRLQLRVWPPGYIRQGRHFWFLPLPTRPLPQPPQAPLPPSPLLACSTTTTATSPQTFLTPNGRVVQNPLCICSTRKGVIVSSYHVFQALGLIVFVVVMFSSHRFFQLQPYLCTSQRARRQSFGPGLLYNPLDVQKRRVLSVLSADLQKQAATLRGKASSCMWCTCSSDGSCGCILLLPIVFCDCLGPSLSHASILSRSINYESDAQRSSEDWGS